MDDGMEAGESPILGRIVVVIDEPFYRHNGRIFSSSTWAGFAGHLAAHCARLTLMPPLADAEPPEGANAVPPNVHVQGRFFYQHVEDCYRLYAWHRHGLLREAQRLFRDQDVVIIRLPLALGRVLAGTAWRLGKPTVALLAGDVLDANRYVGRRGLKAFLARCVARYHRRLELRIAGGSVMTAVWSEGLLGPFGSVAERMALGASPSLSARQIVRRTREWQPPVRLVRVCPLAPTKGVEYLIEAVLRLRRRGLDVRLDIAGDAADPLYLERLKAQVARDGLEDRVTFHGRLPFGPVLFDFYLAGDIHVISSVSEGLPRCLVEGRAFGLPTAATCVGGIPSVVHDGVDGLLVAPRNAEALADAVARLAGDEALRRRIIDEGYRLAERETAEFQARRLATLVGRALRGEALGPAALDLHRI
jgi:glycosyltransferase involved in cell wall biosynthesis